MNVWLDSNFIVLFVSIPCCPEVKEKNIRWKNGSEKKSHNRTLQMLAEKVFHKLVFHNPLQEICFCFDLLCFSEYDYAEKNVYAVNYFKWTSYVVLNSQTIPKALDSLIL